MSKKRDLHVESFHADFNRGKVQYEALQMYVGHDVDGVLHYSSDPQYLSEILGIDESELKYGYFFEVTEKED